MTSKLLKAVLIDLRRGWSQIPTIGKRAAGPWRRFQEQPADESALRRMFAKRGVTGRAVICGKVSGGLAVRDFDRCDSYRTWTIENPDEAARLPTVRTSQNRFHVYGRLDEEMFATLGDGELRADSRHYVVAPPSPHPDGGIYTWVNALPELGTPLPLLPSSLLQKKIQLAAPSLPVAWPTTRAQAEDAIATMIAKTLPSHPGERNSKLFDLARGLMAILGRDADPKRLRSVLLQWHTLALPFVRTKPFDETLSDFIRSWESIKFPMGQSLSAAVAKADAEPFPSEADLYHEPELRRLVAICAQLQIQWGDQPFPLGCRKAGELLGVTPTEAGRLLKVLKFDGVLKLIRKGNKTKTQTGSYTASEWRFINLER